MLSRNLYKVKKAPLSDKRKKAILSVLLAFSLFFIAYGIYSFKNLAPADGQKEELKQDIGDRPLPQTQAIFVNADKGLSLRKDRNVDSERLAVIPDKTKLETIEELDGWYKVSFQGKEGWILKQYTTVDEPVVDQYKDWSAYTGSFKVKYPVGWKIKDYGANSAGKIASLVAFSNQDLPEAIPQGSDFIAPVTIKVSTDSAENIKKDYTSISGVVTEAITVGGLAGEKYTFVTTYSNTQQTAIVVSNGSNVYVFEEAGGYVDDLNNMTKTFSL